MRVDTSVWNLGLPLLLVGGCTEIIALQPDGEGGGSSGDTTTVGGTTTMTTSPTDPTLPDPTTMTMPTSVDPSQTDTVVPGCYSAYDCEQSYCCIEQQCMYFGMCPKGCPPELCCLGMCGSYNCYVDDECGPGSVCSFGACTYIEPEPECMLPLALEFQIPIMVGGEIRALAFVDADGDAQRDVVIGEASRVQLVLAWNQSVVEIAANMEANSLAVGDVDGDMDEDIVVGDHSADGGAVRLLLHDPMVSFVPMTVADMPAVSAVAITDHDGDQLVDLLAIDEMGGLQWLHGLGGPLFEPPLSVWPGATAMAVGSVDGDATQDVVVHQSFEIAFTAGSFEPFQLVESSNGTAQRALALGNFDGAPPDDLVALHTSAGTTVVTAWRSSVLEYSEHKTWWNGSTYVAARADVDDDGHDDVVAAGNEAQFVIGHGAPAEGPSDVIDCVMTVPTLEPVLQLAVGDFTGDGDLDVVTTDGTNLAVYVQTG